MKAHFLNAQNNKNREKDLNQIKEIVNSDPANIDFDRLSLTHQEFHFFRQLIGSSAGIHLPDEKKEMLEMRLNKRLKALGLQNFHQYQTRLKNDTSGEEISAFINVLTTNKTAFFREQYHFDFLKNHIEKQKKYDTTYIWSAACASGEEVYSLAMLCEEINAKKVTFEYRILGTDVDTDRLNMSKGAIYSASQIKEIPLQLRLKYLIDNGNRKNRQFEISEKLKRNIKFCPYNLIDYQANLGVAFDYVFLRNVLYYFSNETSEKIVRHLIKQIKPGGLLFVSLTETLHHMDVDLIKLGHSVYQKPDNS